MRAAVIIVGPSTVWILMTFAPFLFFFYERLGQRFSSLK